MFPKLVFLGYSELFATTDSAQNFHSQTMTSQIIRLPFQFIPYGDSYYTTQFPKIQDGSASNSEEKDSKNQAGSLRPLITPSSSPYELLHLDQWFGQS